MALNMTKNLISLPTHQKRYITKVDGFGMNVFAKKRPADPYGVRKHRMQGTLWGTDTYFRRADVGALTDVGLDHQTAEMLIWIPFWDTNIVPWASGPVTEPYGDALCNLQHNPEPSVGVSLANWGGIAAELSGFFAQPGTSITTDSPWSDASKRKMAQLIARIAHNRGVTYDKFPYDNDGCSVVTWHEEWIGKPGTGDISPTSKHCPGDVVMAATNEVLGISQDLLEAAQRDVAPPPIPVPALVYPEGMDAVTARSAFGKYTDSKTGIVYQFDERGPVSRLWLDLAMVTSLPGQPMRFPEIDHVQMRTGESGKLDKPYFFFSDGLVIYKPNAKTAVAAIGTNPLDDDLRKAA